MLDRVAVPYRERVVVPAGLRVPDEERAVLVLRQQQLLLRLHPLDLAEVPSEKKRLPLVQLKARFEPSTFYKFTT